MRERESTPCILDQLSRYFDDRGRVYRLDRRRGQLETATAARSGYLELALSHTHDFVRVEALQVTRVTSADEQELIVQVGRLCPRDLCPGRWPVEQTTQHPIKRLVTRARRAFDEHFCTLAMLPLRNVPCVDLVHDPQDGQVRAHALLPVRTGKFYPPALGAILDLLEMSTNRLRLALALVREGTPPEKGLELAFVDTDNAWTRVDPSRVRCNGIFMPKPGEEASVVREAEALFQELVHHAPNHGTFIVNNVDRFTDPILAVYARNLTCVSPLLARSLYWLPAIVDSVRMDREKRLLPTDEQRMVEEVDALSGGHDLSGAIRIKEHCQSLLARVDRGRTPVIRNWLQLMLSNAHFRMYLLKANPVDYEQAVISYQESLTVYPWEVSPAESASIYHNLARLYTVCYERMNRTEAALAAEQCFAYALADPRLEADPTGWASARHLLGNLFHVRYERYGRDEDARAAEGHYHAALTENRREVNPLWWAASEHDLGTLFGKRYGRHGREEDARAAVQHLENSLLEFRRENIPQRWASPQHDLGHLFKRRYDRHGKEEDLDRAEQHLRNALEEWRHEDIPIEWALTQNALGTVFAERYEQDGREEDAGAAERHYRAALREYNREAAPAKWAMTRHNLGTLFAERYERHGREEDARAAEEHFRAALTELTPLTAPIEAKFAAESLARLLRQQRRWTEAHDALQIALEAANTQYLLVDDEVERRRLMGEHNGLYHTDALCLLRLLRCAEALARLDEGRARILREAIGLEELARARHDDRGVQEIRMARRRWQAAGAALRAADAHVAGATTETANETALSERRRAQDELKGAIDDLKSVADRLHLTLPTITAESILRMALPPATAVVAIVRAGGETHAIILFSGRVEAVTLPHFNVSSVRESADSATPAVATWIKTYKALVSTYLDFKQAEASGDTIIGQVRLNAAVQAWQFCLDQIAASRGDYQTSWILAYSLTFELVRDEGHSSAQRATETAWARTVERTVATLTKQFWEPLKKVLPAGADRVLLMAPAETGLLPLHAAAPPDLAVACVPSLGVWAQCQARASSLSSCDSSLLLVVPARDLQFADLEAEWTSRQFQRAGARVTLLNQKRATVRAVCEGVADHCLMHFIGHAKYNWGNPLLSSLICTDNPLTVAEVRQSMDLSNTRLVTLSACETGISDVISSSEEFIGLPAGLLEAGAPAIVASLWPVPDISTTLIMDRFYELWLGHEHEVAIAEALRDATRWIRNATKAELLGRIRSSVASSELQLAFEGLAGSTHHESIPLSEAEKAAIVMADVVDALPGERPFASPYYWAAFAAYGAVF